MTVSDRPRRSPARTVVWVLFVACTAGNTALSVRGGALVVHLALGVATLLCLAALAAPHLRGTR